MAAKKTTKKNKAAESSWDRVWVITGDPCLVRLGAETGIDEVGSTSVHYFTPEDDIRHLRSTLEAFHFCDPADAVVVRNPNVAMLDICLKTLETRVFTPAVLIVTVEGDTLDGRTKFALALKKHEEASVFHFDPIEAGDVARLKKHLAEWADFNEQRFGDEAMSWLLSNAPVALAKIKGPQGKREVGCYDLELLESELGKAEAVRKHEGGPITKADLLTLCVFDQAVDVWSFVDAAVSGKADRVLNFLERLGVTQTDTSSLWLLVSQMEFAVTVKSHMMAGVRDYSQIAEKMSIAPLLGHYLKADWTEPDAPAAPPAAANPWRVKKAIENLESVRLDRLIVQYEAALAAIRDLRSGVSVRVVLPCLALALSGEFTYTAPLFNLYS